MVMSDDARKLRSKLIHERQKLGQWPPVGRVRFGSLRRLEPINKQFGHGRGQPIDRYYIEKFLSEHRRDVRGRVLEIGDASYTRKFGDERVTRSDVLNYIEGNPKATIVADLTRADNIPSDVFDCIILTQTLQMIYEARSAVNQLYRILKPGGTLLVTAHGTSRICRREGVDDWGEYWRFTGQSLHHLLAERFARERVEVSAYGNVFAAICFLEGIAAEELDPEEIDHQDPDFEVLVAARAVK